MQIGDTVQIQDADRIWPGARIIGQGKDSLDGSRAVWLVHHYGFSSPIEFYQQADFQGRYYQPGNAGMWMSHQQPAMPAVYHEWTPEEVASHDEWLLTKEGQETLKKQTCSGCVDGWCEGCSPL